MKYDVSTVRTALLRDHANTTDPWRLDAIAQDLAQVVRSVPEDIPIVELGSYKGATAAWVRALLDGWGDTDREVHVFDSFQGLPPASPVDGDHLAEGEIASGPEDVIDTHRRLGLRPPVIHEGWFSQTLNQLPETVAWAYVDCDFYEPMLECLAALVPRIAPSGSFLVDDYADVERNPSAWDGLPGVYAACVEFFGRSHPLEVVFGGGDLAFGRWSHAL